jgi:hypothetical protein
MIQREARLDISVAERRVRRHPDKGRVIDAHFDLDVRAFEDVLPLLGSHFIFRDGDHRPAFMVAEASSGHGAM